MAVLLYLFLEGFGAECPVYETMKVHKAQLLCVVREHLLNKIVFVVSFNFMRQLLPKQFQMSVSETVANGLPFDLVEAYFPTHKLNPALELFLLIRQLINVLTTDLQLGDSLLAPVGLEITDKDVDHLQSTKVKLGSLVVKHVIEDDLTGLVEDHEDVVEAMVVLAEPFLFMKPIQLPESDLFHQKEDVVGAQFVVALLFDRTLMLFSFNSVQTSRCLLSPQQPVLVIVLITEFPTASCRFVLLDRLGH